VGTVTGRSFSARLVDRVEAVSSVLCLGLDPRPPFPDDCLRGLASGRAGMARAVERYCLGALEAAADVAAAVKPQVALFEVLGGYGLTALERVCAAAGELGVPVIADAKRGDIPSTAAAYAAAWLRPRGGEPPVADALTVNPYLGPDSLEPFLAACDDCARGIYVLVRTSNPGSAALQELAVTDEGEPLWQRVAALVADAGAARVDASGLSPVGAVVGLTQPGALARARELMPHAPLLIPGLGAQGGDPRAAEPAFRPHPAGGLVAVARSVLEAWRGAEGDWRAAIADAARDASETTWRIAAGAAHR
jgi:orotidine-5'-phosphate decarboxylase